MNAEGSTVAVIGFGAMTAGDFAPGFPVRPAAKDLRYLTPLAGELAADVPMARAAPARAALAGFRQAAEAGHADDDLAAVATNQR
ncbi:hypothetical protein [Streptomyces sp. KLOTTS4A1]|uniref:hypothetical protein n=1 Tax=Streptomyces sp. KLOTTS4A1 TaxID=3390996 RepID=UPI0039F5ED87